MANDEKSCQGKRSPKVPETIEYGGVQCRVRHHDPAKPYIVTIRHPGPPAQVFEIVHPFGEPGKTLFIDGQAFKVREISEFSSNLTANRSPSPDPAGQSCPMKADSAVLGKNENALSDEPQWRSLQKCIAIKIELPDGGFSEVHVHTFEDNFRYPIGISSKYDAIDPVPAGGLKSLYDEVQDFVIDCNAKVLFAEKFHAVDCFVVMEPLMAIGDLPSKPTPQVDDTESPPDLLSVSEAARYAGVTDRTIRNWLNTNDGNGPMLKGVVGKGSLRRIPRSSLLPYRKKR